MSDEVLDILGSVFAILDIESGEEVPPSYLGTGFVVDEEGTFLTARHVLSGHSGQIAAVFLEPPDQRKDGPRVCAIGEIALAADIDLARGHVDKRDARPIRPSTTPPRAGGDVLSAEYSLSTVIDPATNRMGFADPRIQKGHIVRSFSTDDPPHQRRTQCYELSFPALMGASGAPVVDLDNLTALGVIIANVATHLLPAQVERIEGETREVETRYYYLPHAHAIAYTEFDALIAPA